uniref:TetR/AcrR family transcriptional regulator n=1 Tax=Thaumasiovibrio occultus TaxID=1891184 RepID=UPI000B34B701|nr:TetR/AcrR family transcriptional regulator [Thaumasiovibrio occultus]
MPAPKFTIAEQEQLILDAAVHCILDTSLLDFKMSAIAKHAGLSMGSVYKHIHSKEDVLVALSVRLDQQALGVINTLLALPYSLPSKIVALHLVSEEAMYLYPFSYQLLTLLNSKDLRAKASEKWLGKHAQVSREIGKLFENALADAVQNEELLCTGEDKEALIEEFMLLHWAVNSGYPQIVNYPYELHDKWQGMQEPSPLSLDHPLLRASIRMTNSYHWREPVTREVLVQIEQELVALGLR